jgi:hypothetical protein
LPSIPLLASALAVAPLLAGCLSTPGYERAEKVRDRLTSQRSSVVAISAEIDRTNETLAELADSTDGQSDPRPVFERFVESFEAMQEASEEADDAAREAEGAWRAFARAWERDTAGIGNATVRERADRRRAETAALFDGLRGAQVRAAEALEPYLAELSDLQKYVENDVTPAGLESAKDLFASAQQSGSRVRERFQDLASRIDQVRKAIAPVHPAPAKVR